MVYDGFDQPFERKNSTRPSKIFTKAFLSILASIVLIVVMVLLSGCEYSEGRRVGVITKFSYKGIFCKQYMGEIVMGGMTTNVDGQVMSNVWEFSVPKSDRQLIRKVTDAANSGKRVRLHYKQIIPNLPCLPEYRVDSVEVVE